MDESSKKCILCDEDLSSKPTVTAKKKAIGTFIKASLKKCDNKDTILSRFEELEVHWQCSMKYPSGVTLTKFLGPSEVSTSTTTQTRSLTPFTSSDYNNTCFYCNKDASDNFIEKQKRVGEKRRQVVKFISVNNKAPLDEVKASVAKEGYEILSRFPDINHLIDHQARYHEKCRGKFKLINLHTSRKSDDSSPRDEAINLICSHIVNNKAECQFSINEILKNSNVEEIPNENYLKNKLQITFGSDVIVHSTESGLIVSLLRTGEKIRTAHWHKNKKALDTAAERKRIVETAAMIILEDIRAKIYEKNCYPAPDCFFDNAETEVPETLRSFFEIIFANSTEKLNVKCTALAHAIISIVRPRSFLSTLQIGLGAMVNKTFGSKYLIDILSALGFCAPYENTLSFESSVLKANEYKKYEDSFVQYVYDNADHNLQTIDGKNSETIIIPDIEKNSNKSESICEESFDGDISADDDWSVTSLKTECETNTLLDEPPEKKYKL